MTGENGLKITQRLQNDHYSCYLVVHATEIAQSWDCALMLHNLMIMQT